MEREWAALWDAYGREEFEVLIRIVKEVTAYRVQASLSPFSQVVENYLTFEFQFPCV